MLDSFISGLGAGLALATILGLFEAGKRRWERREQIRYLAKLIGTERKNFIKWIERFQPSKDDLSDEEWREEEKWRTYLYESMRRTIETTLDGRCARLTFDETNEIREMLLRWNRKHDGALLFGEAYNTMFKELEGITWLSLPPGPYFPNQTNNGNDSHTTS